MSQLLVTATTFTIVDVGNNVILNYKMRDSQLLITSTIVQYRNLEVHTLSCHNTNNFDEIEQGYLLPIHKSIGYHINIYLNLIFVATLFIISY